MTIDRHPPIIPGFSHLLHGGDWNPDQWLDQPQVIDEDFRLFALAGANALSLGIFSWTKLEPEEGRYDFVWMDRIMDRLANDGRKAILATPSGAKPAWMALKYPEIRRVRDGKREPHYSRHNHCFTSPVYRAKVQAINIQLAERYAQHPALGAWHLSNEYSGDCQCTLCWAAFRTFVKTRHGDLAAVNRAWYSSFWSHTFTAWEEIDHLDTGMHGMVLDWRRFVSEQTIDFMRVESEPLRRQSPQVPITTNLMGTFQGLDYFRLGRAIDFSSWDSYPVWYRGDGRDAEVACEAGFHHDLMRMVGRGKPFMLMESTPSQVNWHSVSRPKPPGMHRVSSLQAVAHGSDSVCYFQWRKSRGSCEKFHGAVVDHVGHENTRVFRDVAALGASLKRLEAVVGLPVSSAAAVMYDWEVSWAIDSAQMGRNTGKDYIPTCMAHYRPLWHRGISTDVIDQTCDLTPYRMLVAPMLHLLRPGFAERLQAWVASGGILITTYLTGMVDENDQCFLSGWPGPLRQLLGIWTEEGDTPPDDASVPISTTAGGLTLGLRPAYVARQYCDLIHAEGAEVLATYAGEWYAGRPAITRHRVGLGEAWHVAVRGDEHLIEDIVGGLADRLSLERPLTGLPEGVVARQRGTGPTRHVFVMNFSGKPQSIELGSGWCDAEEGSSATSLSLSAYDARVLTRREKVFI